MKKLQVLLNLPDGDFYSNVMVFNNSDAKALHW